MMAHAKMLTGGAVVAALLACVGALPNDIPLCDSGNLAPGMPNTFTDNPTPCATGFLVDLGSVASQPTTEAKVTECQARGESYLSALPYSYPGTGVFMFMMPQFGACQVLVGANYDEIDSCGATGFLQQSYSVSCIFEYVHPPSPPAPSIGPPTDVPLCSEGSSDPGYPGVNDDCHAPIYTKTGTGDTLADCVVTAEAWIASNDVDVSGGYWVVSDNYDHADYDIDHEDTDCHIMYGRDYRAVDSCSAPANAFMSASCFVNPSGGSPPSPDAAVTGDPHFGGFNKAKYDYHGTPGAVFNLISTVNTQVNAMLGPDHINGLTYMNALGVSTGASHVKVSVVEGRMQVLVDDGEVPRTGTPTPFKGGSITFANNGVAIETIDLRMVLSVHKDLFIDVDGVSLTREVRDIHGVLGQTAGAGADTATTYLGEDSDYYVSDLWACDFKHNVFRVTPEAAGRTVIRGSIGKVRLINSIRPATATVVNKL